VLVCVGWGGGVGVCGGVIRMLTLPPTRPDARSSVESPPPARPSTARDMRGSKCSADRSPARCSRWQRASEGGGVGSVHVCMCGWVGGLVR
jgi:hypothetical protein